MKRNSDEKRLLLKWSDNEDKLKTLCVVPFTPRLSKEFPHMLSSIVPRLKTFMAMDSQSHFKRMYMNIKNGFDWSKRSYAMIGSASTLSEAELTYTQNKRLQPG